jgi:hypothetical protein
MTRLLVLVECAAERREAIVETVVDLDDVAASRASHTSWTAPHPTYERPQRGDLGIWDENRTFKRGRPPGGLLCRVLENSME